jgi:hypothetical protein
LSISIVESHGWDRRRTLLWPRGGYAAHAYSETTAATNVIAVTTGQARVARWTADIPD